MDLAAMDTPTGIIEVGVDGGALVSLQFVEMSTAPPDRVAAPDPGGIRARLRAYYGGELGALAEIPVRFDRGTFFQQQVWRALQGIPVGETISYAELARRVGRPSAFRAVGSANGQNPVAVVVPCHRVIAADGTLGGYGGGLDRKRWLLAHEGAMAPQEPAIPGLAV
jgi:methylated-DNA-[protein]-cysteine S-methyltransferase